MWSRRNFRFSIVFRFMTWKQIDKHDLSSHSLELFLGLYAQTLIHWHMSLNSLSLKDHADGALRL